VPLSAGGGDSMITLRLPTHAVPGGSQLLEVAVEGLMGGHSGINIHEDRGEAPIEGSLEAPGLRQDAGILLLIC